MAANWSWSLNTIYFQGQDQVDLHIQSRYALLKHSDVIKYVSRLTKNYGTKK